MKMKRSKESSLPRTVSQPCIINAENSLFACKDSDSLNLSLYQLIVYFLEVKCRLENVFNAPIKTAEKLSDIMSLEAAICREPDIKWENTVSAGLSGTLVDDNSARIVTKRRLLVGELLFLLSYIQAHLHKVQSSEVQAKLRTIAEKWSSHLHDYDWHRTIGSNEVEKVCLEEFVKYGYTETKAVQLVHSAVERGATDILMPIDWALRQIEEDWVDMINNPNVASFDRSSARQHIQQLGFSRTVAFQYAARIFASAAPYHLNIPEWTMKLLEADWLISCPLTNEGAAAAFPGAMCSAEADGSLTSTVRSTEGTNDIIQLRAVFGDDAYAKFRSLLIPENYQPYFHGTQLKSAKQLTCHLTQKPRGKHRQDFSNGDGFYVGQDFQIAMHWAGRHGYVIVYFVPDQLLENSSQKFVDLTRNQLEPFVTSERAYDFSVEESRLKIWKSIVRYFRTDNAESGNIEELAHVASLVDGVAFIRGYVAEYKYRSMEDWCHKDIRPLHNVSYEFAGSLPPVQVCIRSHVLMTVLHRFLAAVITLTD